MKTAGRQSLIQSSCDGFGVCLFLSSRTLKKTLAFCTSSSARSEMGISPVLFLTRASLLQAVYKTVTGRIASTKALVSCGTEVPSAFEALIFLHLLSDVSRLVKRNTVSAHLSCPNVA